MNTLRKVPWQEVSLGDLLTYTDERVHLDDAAEYLTITVKRRHGGLEERERILGHQIKTKKQFRLIPGAFIISRVQCWHQAYAIVPDDIPPNMIASVNYDQFTVSSKVDRRFFWWFSHSPYFTNTVRSSAFGVVIEKMVFDRDAWLKKTIPLPTREEQCRIVARIEELSAKVKEARALRQEAVQEAEILTASYLTHIFDGAAAKGQSQTRLGDVCVFHGGSQPAKLEFAYQPRDGYIRLIQIRDYKSDDYLTYVPKDSVRKFCSADDVMIGRYGPPIFQILRGIEGAYNVALMKASPDPARLSREFLFYLLREPRLFQKVEEDSQRTSGQTGVRKELLEDHVTFIPPLPEQRKIVADLDGLKQRADSLKALQTETSIELNALMPSILDKAFRGEL
jgi:type I restriction enzyme, S subunit